RAFGRVESHWFSAYPALTPSSRLPHPSKPTTGLPGTPSRRDSGRAGLTSTAPDGAGPSCVADRRGSRLHIGERHGDRRQPGDLTMDYGRARSSFFAPFGSACAFFTRAPAAVTRFLSRSGCASARAFGRVELI